MERHSAPPSADEPMTCEAVRELLSPYADDELGPRLTLAVSAHLASCPACTVELNSLRRAGDLVRQFVGRPATPDLLRARVRAAIRDASGELASQHGRPVSRRRRLAGWPLVAAAGLAVAIASSGTTLAVLKWPRGTSSTRFAHAVVERHVQSLMQGRTIEVASSDRHTVKPWFNGRVDFSPDVPRLDSIGFPLLGGRVDTVSHRAVAALVYGRRKHLINVFTWPGRAGTPATVDRAVVTERGYHTLHWTGDGMEFWAVSDVAVGDLRTFAQAFARDVGPVTEGDPDGAQ